MRQPRLKMRGQPAYYHVYNRTAGYQSDRPFNDVDRERAFDILDDLRKYFFVEVIAVSFMSNHWHAVCFTPTPEQLPHDKTIAERHNAYYQGKQPLPIDPDDAEACKRVREEMVDISTFAGRWQQQFTVKYNDAHERRGQLWEGRFKNSILDHRTALWDCVAYVELNPVRAGMVDDPADYRFCTWGRYAGSGTHPCEDNFLFHMRRSLGDDGDGTSDEQIYDKFRMRLARGIAAHKELTGAELEEHLSEAREPVSLIDVMLRRSRYWRSGAIIGGKSFIQEVASHFFSQDRVARQQLGRTEDPSGGVHYSWRRLPDTASAESGP